MDKPIEDRIRVILSGALIAAMSTAAQAAPPAFLSVYANTAR
jgi:hypothetical protein